MLSKEAIKEDTLQFYGVSKIHHISRNTFFVEREVGPKWSVYRRPYAFQDSRIEHGRVRS